MMRPVILSRPENSALLLSIFCDGGSATLPSPGRGGTAAGWGAPRGLAAPGGKPRIHARRGALGRGQRLRLQTRGRTFADLPRIGLIGILLLRIARPRVALVRIGWIALLLRARLAAGHA